MRYKEILSSPAVKSLLAPSRKWWSDYIYHFSHITNVANILNINQLKSRAEIKRNQPMDYSDNASLGVIEGTNFDVHEYVRFYFRPLTPTQYNNEGIRSRSESNQYNAHCPVPVFLLFDTDILEDENTLFTYESLASRREVKRYNSINDFINAPFRDIYHKGPISLEEDSRTIKKRRHAEVLIKDSSDLTFLKWIVCRTEAEKETLINMMDGISRFLFLNRIIVLQDIHSKEMFYYDKLMIEHVTQNNIQTIISFNKHDLQCRNVSIYWTRPDGFILHWWAIVNGRLGDYMTDGNNLVIDRKINTIGISHELSIYIDANLVFQKDYYS